MPVQCRRHNGTAQRDLSSLATEARPPQSGINAQTLQTSVICWSSNRAAALFKASNPEHRGDDAEQIFSKRCTPLCEVMTIDSHTTAPTGNPC